MNLTLEKNLLKGSWNLVIINCANQVSSVFTRNVISDLYMIRLTKLIRKLTTCKLLSFPYSIIYFIFFSSSSLYSFFFFFLRLARRFVHSISKSNQGEGLFAVKHRLFSDWKSSFNFYFFFYFKIILSLVNWTGKLL